MIRKIKIQPVLTNKAQQNDVDNTIQLHLNGVQ